MRPNPQNADPHNTFAPLRHNAGIDRQLVTGRPLQAFDGVGVRSALLFLRPQEFEEGPSARIR
jgi:hypothetical protein